MDVFEITLVTVICFVLLFYAILYDWPSMRMRKLINKIPGNLNTYYLYLRGSRMKPEGKLFCKF